MIHNDTYIWDIYHHFFNRKIHSFKGSIYPIFLSSYVFSWQNGALEPFEDEKSSSSWPAMVGRWVERLYTSHVVRRISTNYTWHQPKQDTIFVLRKSLKTTIPVASSLIPPNPKVILNGSHYVPLFSSSLFYQLISPHKHRAPLLHRFKYDPWDSPPKWHLTLRQQDTAQPHDFTWM